MLVLWAHFRGLLPEAQQYPWVQTTLGAIGVDIFFVISGFIISLTIDKRESNWRLFAARRVARVVPIYYLICLPFLLRAAIVRPHEWLQKIWNTLAFLPVLDFNSFTNPVHLYGWTLCFEMWFYLVVTIALIFLPKKSVIGAVLAFFVLGVLLQTSLYQGSWTFPRFAFNPMVLEFCCGCLIYLFREKLNRWICGAVAIAFVPLLFFHQQLGWHGEVLIHPNLAWTRMLVWGGFAAFLVATVVSFDRVRPFAPKGLLSMLGNASYSIYLVQPICWLLVITFLPPGWGAVAAFVAMAGVGGFLTWKLIERPVTSLARRLCDRLFRVGGAAA